MRSHLRRAIERKKRLKSECAAVFVAPILRSPSRLRVPGATAVLLLLLAAMLCYGCVGSAPEIIEVMQTVVFRYDPAYNTSFESLHLYTLLSDADGIGDISEIYIANAEQSIFWELNPDSWDQYTVDDRRWIGSHTLRMPQSRVIPRGLYNLQAYDRAGEGDAQQISILQSNSIENTTINFPSLTYGDRMVNLTSEYRYNVLRWYYHADQIFDYRGEAGSIPLESIAPDLEGEINSGNFTMPTTSTFYIYAFPTDDVNDYYVLVGPIAVR